MDLELCTLEDITDDMIELYENQRFNEITVKWFKAEKERILKWNPKRKVMIAKSGIYLTFFVDNIAEKYRRILTLSTYNRPNLED